MRFALLDAHGETIRDWNTTDIVEAAYPESGLKGRKLRKYLAEKQSFQDGLERADVLLKKQIHAL